MKISIDKASLLSALAIARSIADRKSTMPILGNVLLRAAVKDRLLVAATDLNITVTAELPCQVIAPGAHTVGAGQLHEIAKSLPGSAVGYETVDAGFAEITALKTRFKLVGLADRDFPKLPASDDATFAKVDAAALASLIARSSYCTSTDESRYHLNGAQLAVDKAGEEPSVRMAATDGHRLSVVKAALDVGQKKGFAALIPRRALHEMQRLLDSASGEVEIGFSKSHAFLRVGAVQIAAKLIEAQFPPYEQVIPKTNERVLVADRTALLESIKRIVIMASDKTNGIILDIDGASLTIKADNPDLGEAREQLDVDPDGDHFALAIGASARYLRDALEAAGSLKVRLAFNGDVDPILITPVDGDEVTGVVMPMRT